MNEDPLHIENAPIIEVVLDIDCDLPTSFDLKVAEPDIRAALGESYPNMHQQLIQEHKISQQGDSLPELSVQRGLRSLQFLTSDKKQIVQFRTGGFSFNKLSPYTHLEDYLAEIQRTWGLFQELAKPVQLRKIGLRTINRISLPMLDGRVKLEDYLQTCPRLPDEDRLTFVGFLNHHMAVEQGTGNRVNIVLTTLAPEHASLPLILDIDAFRPCQIEPASWDSILNILISLRGLKNSVFRNTVTQTCLKRFTQSA